MDSLFIGIDEAGRGAAIGPLVMYGVGLRGNSDQLLAQKFGAKDSKKLSATRRYTLSESIKKSFVYDFEIAHAEDVDEYTNMGKLNVLERMMAEKIIMRMTLHKDIGNVRVVLDGTNVFIGMESRLQETWPLSISKVIPTILISDHAEDQYVEVACASICAKSTRDQKVYTIMNDTSCEKLSCVTNPPWIRGSGYPNEFTAAWVDFVYQNSLGRSIKHVRKSWSWFEKQRDQRGWK
jgi:ribonuclease HII